MGLFWKKKNDINEKVNEHTRSYVPLSVESIYETLSTWKENLRNCDMTYTIEKRKIQNENVQYSLKSSFYDLYQVKSSFDFSGNPTISNTIGYAREMLERKGMSPSDRYFAVANSFPIVLLSPYEDHVCCNILEAVIEDHEGEEVAPLDLLDDVFEWCQYAGVLAAVTYNIDCDFSKFESPYFSITRGKGLDEIIRLLEIKTMNTNERFEIYEECFPRIREQLIAPIHVCESERMLIAQIAQCILTAYSTAVSMELDTESL